MVGGITTGNGFGGAVDYDLDKNRRRDKNARVLYAEGIDVDFNDDGSISADKQRVVRSFRRQSNLRPRVTNPVKHVFLSYEEKDLIRMLNNAYRGKRYFTSIEDAESVLSANAIRHITDKAMVEDAMRYLRRMNWQKTQFMIVRHSEKNNPHIHIVLNMVDSEGKRLKDLADIKRTIKACAEITEARRYTWGHHKSVSHTDYNRLKDEARAYVCHHIMELSHSCKDAAELTKRAEGKGITVKYRMNGTEVEGVNFIFSVKDKKDTIHKYVFTGRQVDKSLSAKSLFPFHDSKINPAYPPEPPKWVQESQRREIYHGAVANAIKNGSPWTYLFNLAALGLDPECGSEADRAEAIAPYLRESENNRIVDLTVVQSILKQATNPNLSMSFNCLIQYLNDKGINSFAALGVKSIPNEYDQEQGYSCQLLAKEIETAYIQTHSEVRTQANKMEPKAETDTATAETAPSRSLAAFAERFSAYSTRNMSSIKEGGEKGNSNLKYASARKDEILSIFRSCTTPETLRRELASHGLTFFEVTTGRGVTDITITASGDKAFSINASEFGPDYSRLLMDAYRVVNMRKSTDKTASNNNKANETQIVKNTSSQIEISDNNQKNNGRKGNLLQK